MPHFDLIEGLLGRPIEVDPNVPGFAWSIRNNIKMLLNTRQGELNHLPDYGLPELTEFPVSSFEDDTKDFSNLKDEIASVIAKYEPRITDIEIFTGKTDFYHYRAEFIITARITKAYQTHVSQFLTRLSYNGNFSVEFQK